jgi:transcriptional regulator with XRE-family HTH domain
VDDQSVGIAFRAARIRKGWTQQELGARCGVSHGLISLIERGHLDSVSLRVLRRVARELDVFVVLRLRSRGGDLDRLVNAGHAALHEELARHLDALPDWLHAPEVSFAVFGERGVIDILAFHPPTGSLLVIELKTELVSFEDLLMTMDVRMRHAERIARERSWTPTSVSAWVVVAESKPNRRRAARHRALLRSAFPQDGRQVRGWLQRPEGSIRALSFWSNSTSGSASQSHAIRRRVRKSSNAEKAARIGTSLAQPMP